MTIWTWCKSCGTRQEMKEVSSHGDLSVFQCQCGNQITLKVKKNQTLRERAEMAFSPPQTPKSG